RVRPPVDEARGRVTPRAEAPAGTPCRRPAPMGVNRPSRSAQCLPARPGTRSRGGFDRPRAVTRTVYDVRHDPAHRE
ncbi:hypothetical protein, partial [Streptomyces halstedii]|uniref:hypothetical protein n=1 Tax=Streptomyces halstedii TaxID=1944 RepID=UPI00194250FA